MWRMCVGVGGGWAGESDSSSAMLPTECCGRPHTVAALLSQRLCDSTPRLSLDDLVLTPTPLLTSQRRHCQHTSTRHVRLPSSFVGQLLLLPTPIPFSPPSIAPLPPHRLGAELRLPPLPEAHRPRGAAHPAPHRRPAPPHRRPSALPSPPPSLHTRPCPCTQVPPSHQPPRLYHRPPPPLLPQLSALRRLLHRRPSPLHLPRH